MQWLFAMLPDDLDKTISLAQKLVRIPSVTALAADDAPASHDVLEIAAEAALKSGAVVTRLDFEGGHEKWGYPVSNLYLEWSFGEPEKHICYIGHLDVVPPGNAGNWSADPFSGKVEDGFLYGRGITDMKGSVAAFLAAVGEAVSDMKDSNIRISMILTTDEEWAAVNGSRKVMQWLQEQEIAPDAFIVGEPSSQDTLGSHIKVGRRGSLCGTLSVDGVQGHAAYQDLFENPNRALALAAAILNSQSWNDGNINFPNTNFEVIATKSGDFNASAVVPGKADLLWNIRFTPEHTPESLEAWMQETLANPPGWARAHPDFDLLRNVTVTANKDTASQPYYSAPGTLAESARSAVNSVTGAQAKFDGSGGTTDGRFAAEIFPGAEIIELGLPERGGIVNGLKKDDYLDKGGMHQVDERASVRDLIDLKDIFKKTMLNYDSGGTKDAAPKNTSGSGHPAHRI